MLIEVPVWCNLVLLIYPLWSLKSPWIWFWQMGKNPDCHLSLHCCLLVLPVISILCCLHNYDTSSIQHQHAISQGHNCCFPVLQILQETKNLPKYLFKIQQNNCIIRCTMKRRFYRYKNVKIAKICVYDSCIHEQWYTVRSWVFHVALFTGSNSSKM